MTAAVPVEGDHAVALRVGDLIAEDRRSLSPGHGALQPVREALAVEEVVAERQGTGVAPDERLADQKGLGQPVGARLLGVVQCDSPSASVAEQPVESRRCPAEW